MKKLLIVDVQKGFLNEDCNFVVKRIENLLKEGNFDQVVATKFVNKQNSAYVEFLDWRQLLTDDEKEIALKLPKNAKIVKKTSYALEEKDFQKLFKTGDEVFVCGLDFDACVLAICFQLFDHKIQPKVVLDAVASHSENPMPRDVFERLCRRNFGEESLIQKLKS